AYIIGMLLVLLIPWGPDGLNRVLVVIGWTALIKGLMIVMMPNLWARTFRPMIVRSGRFFGIAILALGAALCAMALPQLYLIF
ncbi:MAG: hypothetical protein KGL21_00330, partial [Alphaproteobacteria bacterium]|nr:hypothetical protein [Alphaproteobacteria bacterium]